VIGRAIALAKDAIDVARRRGARLAECRASITYGSALVAEHGIEKCDEAEKMFCRAKDLIRISGAKIYEPLLHLERGRITALISAERC
jgi:hypothetical protein